MCSKKEKGAPNMTLLAKPCKKAIIIKEDKAKAFLRNDNGVSLKRVIDRSKKFDHIVTDKTTRS